MNKENEELKPCPFCGGEAEIVISGGERRVDCKKCGARSDWYDTEVEAVAAWNNRDYLTEEIQARLKKLGYYEEEAGGASVAYLLAENRDLRKALVALKNAKVNCSEFPNISKLTYADMQEEIKRLRVALRGIAGEEVNGEMLSKWAKTYKQSLNNI